MNASQVAAAESLYPTATQPQCIGLIVDRTALAPQCLTANCSAEEESAPERASIGVAYLNLR